MKVIYVKWHNNYDFVLGREYETQPYKKGWLLIDGQLYREECFKKSLISQFDSTVKSLTIQRR